jgi:hypothetical protein
MGLTLPQVGAPGPVLALCPDGGSRRGLQVAANRFGYEFGRFEDEKVTPSATAQSRA